MVSPNISSLPGEKNMKKMLIPLILAFLVALSLAASAQRYQPPTTSGGSGMALLNLEDTVAIHGYDPTAYFFEKRAIKGRKWIHERLGGATYYFRSRANRYEFLSDAPKYQPQFGGYCATSMSRGRLEDIDPHLFAVYNGKLYLFHDPEAQSIFWANPELVIHEAATHYFELARQKRQRW
jgi:YHS domain-containing protein